jgi:hypothetical protein
MDNKSYILFEQTNDNNKKPIKLVAYIIKCPICGTDFDEKNCCLNCGVLIEAKVEKKIFGKFD